MKTNRFVENVSDLAKKIDRKNWAIFGGLFFVFILAVLLTGGRNETKDPTVEQKTKAPLAVHLKASKEGRLSEIRFDGKTFKDMDSFEEYFQKKGMSGDLPLEFIDETHLENKHTMKAANVAKARKQRTAVAWVKRKKGWILYDYEYGYDLNRYGISGFLVSTREAKPPGPDWLRKWIGIDYFCDVGVVDLSHTPTCKTFPNLTDISPLADLTNLEFLNLSFTQISNLSPLKDLTSLEQLKLVNTQITDFSPLKSLTNLKWLDLMSTQVSDISPLKGLKNLEFLDLGATPVTDFSPLEGLTSLESLNLDETQVTDLSPLSGLKNLTELYFHRTQVTDLSPLAGLTNLEHLDLAHTQVKDLSPLVGFKSLRDLWLTGVSKEKIMTIQKALPDCIIWK